MRGGAERERKDGRGDGCRLRWRITTQRTSHDVRTRETGTNKSHGFGDAHLRKCSSRYVHGHVGMPCVPVLVFVFQNCDPWVDRSGRAGRRAWGRTSWRVTRCTGPGSMLGPVPGGSHVQSHGADGQHGVDARSGWTARRNGGKGWQWRGPVQDLPVHRQRRGIDRAARVGNRLGDGGRTQWDEAVDTGGRLGDVSSCIPRTVCWSSPTGPIPGPLCAIPAQHHDPNGFTLSVLFTWGSSKQRVGRREGKHGEPGSEAGGGSSRDDRGGGAAPRGAPGGVAAAGHGHERADIAVLSLGRRISDAAAQRYEEVTNYTADTTGRTPYEARSRDVDGDSNLDEGTCRYHMETLRGSNDGRGDDSGGDDRRAEFGSGAHEHFPEDFDVTYVADPWPETAVRRWAVAGACPQLYDPLEPSSRTGLAWLEAGHVAATGTQLPAGLRPRRVPGNGTVQLHHGPEPPSRAGMGPLDTAVSSPRARRGRGGADCRDRGRTALAIAVFRRGMSSADAAGRGAERDADQFTPHLSPLYGVLYACTCRDGHDAHDQPQQPSSHRRHGRRSSRQRKGISSRGKGPSSGGRTHGKLLMRVGEATNPGPVQSRVSIGPVAYPSPSQPGFHGAMVMEPCDEPPSNAKGMFGLKVETCNATAWGPLRRYLRRSPADVILAQEHHLGPDQLPAKSTWAIRNGWHAIFAPAQRGEGQGWRAGVAIFARPHMGLAMPKHGSHIVIPHRAVAATVHPPGHRQTTVLSLYLEDGKGLGNDNLQHLSTIGRFLTSQGEGTPFIAGGDFQVKPAELAAAGFAQETDADIVASACPRGTCRSTRASTEIDYFIVHKLLLIGIRDIATVEDAGTRPHVPVRLEFHPRLTTAKALMLRQPPKMGSRRVFGPLPRPPDWATVRDDLRNLITRARQDHFAIDDTFRAAYEGAYQRWADLAEREIEAADANMQALPKRGLRGRRPELKWRSILPEKPPSPSEDEAILTRWRNAANAMTDVKRMMYFYGTVHDEDAADEDLRGQVGQGDQGEVCGHVLRDALGDVWMQLAGIELRQGGDARDGVLGQSGDDEEFTYADVVVRLRAITQHMMRIADRHAADGETALREALGAALDGRLAGIVHDLDADINRALQAAAARLKQQEAERWREWVSKNISAGARNAHRFLRLPDEWRPTTVISLDGVTTAAPSELIMGYERKYSTLWNGGEDGGSGGGGDPPWRGRNSQPLPRPEPSALRAAARTFDYDTATAYDGFSMRQYEWLSDEALEALADVVELMERTGEMPQQLTALAMPLIAKPRGGHRAVATFVSLYRLWNRLRREEVRRWEATVDRPYFAAGSSRAPQDAVWRQAARAEAAVAEHGHSATLLWDLAAFFESVKRRPLWHRAARLQFPMAIASVAMNAYDSVRMLSMAGAMSKPLHAQNGVPAGCGYAMAFTKAYCAEAYDRAVEALRTLHSVPPRLTVYVDDIAISAEGSAAQVVACLEDAEQIIRDEIEGPLACAIEKGKAAVVASSRRVAQTLRRKFGEYAGMRSDSAAGGGARAEATTAVSGSSSQADRARAARARTPTREQATLNLGIDFAPGRRRSSHGPATKRKSRMQRLRKQAQKVAKLRTIAGKRTSSIFVTGPLAAATYGAAVNGFTDKEVLQLRRAAAHAFTPRAKGRSLSRLTLLAGVPTWKAEMEIALQYSREVWRAGLLGHAEPLHGQLTLPQIAQIWRAIDTRSVLADGGNRRVWSEARGPITSLHLTLHRIGWGMKSPFIMLDDFGDEIVLTKTAPQMVAQMLRSAVTRALQREVGGRIAEQDDTFASRRVATEHVEAQLKSDRKLTAHDRACYRSVACGAIMTYDKASRAGYMVANLCPLCHCGPDTIFHRIWQCRHADAVAARNECAPLWLQREANSEQGAANRAFWTTGFIPHPGDVWPRPCHDANAIFEWHGSGQPTARDRNAGGGPLLRGMNYIDGSCTTGIFAELRRAASAVVQWSRQAPSGWIVHLPVPSPLPQTPQAAEYAALAVVRQFADKTAAIEVASDCANVVADAGPVTARATRAARAYAAFNKENLADVQWRAVSTVRKVPAHVNPQTLPDGPARDDAIGNQMADEAAKQAVLLHPQPAPAMVKDLEAKLWRAKLVVRTIARVTQVYPPMPKDRMVRPPRAVEGAAAAIDGGHTWKFGSGLWRCTTCMRLTISPDIGPEQIRDRCPGPKATLEAEAIVAKGHHLAKSLGEVPVLFCIRCGSFAARRAYGLAATCPGRPSPAGKQALARIRLGRQPWLDRAAGEYRRANREAPMAWDSEAKSFMSVGPTRARRRRGTNAAAGADADGRRLDASSRGDADNQPQARQEGQYVLGPPMTADGDAQGSNGTEDMIVDDGSDGAPGNAQMRAHDCAPARGGLDDDATSSAAPRRIKRWRSQAWVHAQGHASTGGVATERDIDDDETSRPAGMSHDASHQGRLTEARDDHERRGGESEARRVRSRTAADAPGEEVSGRQATNCRQDEGERQIGERVQAVGTYNSAAVAREGPRGTADPTATAAAACAIRRTAAAAVGRDAEVATLNKGDHAHLASAGCGEATRSPASGVAAPLENSKDAAGYRLGQVCGDTSPRTPQAESGGRPQMRHRFTSSPHDVPTNLGTGPSIDWQVLSDEQGKPPTGERRREGNSGPDAHASAARGCYVAAAQGIGERPQGGRARRVPGARINECQFTSVAERSSVAGGMLTQRGSARPHGAIGRSEADDRDGATIGGVNADQDGRRVACGGEVPRHARGGLHQGVDAQRLHQGRLRADALPAHARPHDVCAGERVNGDCDVTAGRSSGQLVHRRGAHIDEGTRRETVQHGGSSDLVKGTRVVPGINRPIGAGRGDVRPAPLPPRAAPQRHRPADARAQGGAPRAPREDPRPADTATALAANGAGGEGADGGRQWVMPWERRPTWMYLPHLDDEAPRACGTEGRKRSHLAGGGSPQEDNVGRAVRARTNNSGDGTDAKPVEGQQAAQTGTAVAIRGRGNAPGPRGDSDAPPQRPGDAGRIRGHAHVPGTERRDAVSRARQRLDAQHSLITQSLADHAERVNRRERNGDRAPQPTAAERMAALRRRLAERQANNRGGATTVADAEDLQQPRTCGSTVHDARGTSSIEDAKIHFAHPEDADQPYDADQRTAQAPAAAASFAAWHTAATTSPTP